MTKAATSGFFCFPAVWSLSAEFARTQDPLLSQDPNSNFLLVISKSSFDKIVANQLKRAALSIPINIAEGFGRNTKTDQKNFYVSERGSVFECVSILDILFSEKLISIDQKEYFYKQAKELSQMLFAMIQRLEAANQLKPN
ncbi:MAG: four helix bundle protein [Cytophagaceae bacterium]|jgi:four helix bundle protein|nr:four helix bundle protein [Cytophagaceae bacterium]